MGRTWPNLDADAVTVPGYYWNEKLKKLARLQIGEKLPRRVGKWEFVAGEGEGSSSEIARRIFDRYPGLDVQEFTYTTTTPLDRRLPMGDHPPKSWRQWLSRGVAMMVVWMASKLLLKRFG